MRVLEKRVGSVLQMAKDSRMMGRRKVFSRRAQSGWDCSAAESETGWRCVGFKIMEAP